MAEPVDTLRETRVETRVKRACSRRLHPFGYRHGIYVITLELAASISQTANLVTGQGERTWQVSIRIFHRLAMTSLPIDYIVLLDCLNFLDPAQLSLREETKP